MFRVEVWVKEGFADPRSEGLQKDILDLGIKTVKRIRFVNRIYMEQPIRLSPFGLLVENRIHDF